MGKILTESEKALEGNELIAVFMGYERYEDNQGVWLKKEGLIISMHPKLEDLKYHESWDALMPVVEKIETIQMEKHGYFAVYISSNNCTIEGTKYTPELRDEVYHFYIYSVTKINATWHAVKEFIRWYNERLTASRPGSEK